MTEPKRTAPAPSGWCMTRDHDRCAWSGCHCSCHVIGTDEPVTGALAARLDGCPTACGNAEVPFGIYGPPSGGLVALYKCTDCGTRWHTSWAQEVA